MRTHVVIGGRILSGHHAPVMQMAYQIAMGHHERWDSQGYPERLAGSDIPLPARVVAICDVFDALTSVRPYKRAWSMEEALGYIREQRGRHFDPQLVDCFLEIIREIISIRDRFSD